MDNIGNYNLGFISDEDIYNHVKATVEKYRTSINLQEFNDNIVDPIRLTCKLPWGGLSEEPA